MLLVSLPLKRWIILRRSPVPNESNKAPDTGKDTGKRKVSTICLTSPSEEVIDGKRKRNSREEEREQEMSKRNTPKQQRNILLTPTMQRSIN